MTMKRKLKQLLVTMLSIAMIATMSGITSFNSKAADPEYELVKTQPFTVEKNSDGTFTVSASVSAFPTFTKPDGFTPNFSSEGVMHFRLVVFNDRKVSDLDPALPDNYVSEMAYEMMEDMVLTDDYDIYRFMPAFAENTIQEFKTVYGAAEIYTYSGTSFSQVIPENSTGVFVMVLCVGEYEGEFSSGTVDLFSSIGGNVTLPTEPGQKGGNTLPGDPAPDDPAPAPGPMTEHEAHLSKASIDPVKNTDGSYNMTVFGIPQFKCSICGEIHQDYSKAQEVWFDEILKSATDHSNLDSNWKHSEAEVGKPVNITTRTFYSFDKATLEKLAELGKDITLDFVYDNVNYLMTVPGDYDLPSLANEDGWAGFMYLLSIFGGQVVE